MSLPPPMRSPGYSGCRRHWDHAPQAAAPLHFLSKASGDLPGQAQEQRVTHLTRGKAQAEGRAMQEAPGTARDASCFWSSWNGRFLF